MTLCCCSSSPCAASLPTRPHVSSHVPTFYKPLRDCGGGWGERAVTSDDELLAVDSRVTLGALQQGDPVVHLLRRVCVAVQHAVGRDDDEGVWPERQQPMRERHIAPHYKSQWEPTVEKFGHTLPHSTPKFPHCRFCKGTAPPGGSVEEEPLTSLDYPRHKRSRSSRRPTFPEETNPAGGWINWI